MLLFSRTSVLVTGAPCDDPAEVSPFFSSLLGCGITWPDLLPHWTLCARVVFPDGVGGLPLHFTTRSVLSLHTVPLSTVYFFFLGIPYRYGNELRYPPLLF